MLISCEIHRSRLSQGLEMSENQPNDVRYKLLNAAIRKHQSRSDSLIAILHKAQELFGFLDKPILLHIARSLRLPPSRVQGVVTFYHFFRLKPPGAHTCVICLGTACFVKGADKLLGSAEKTLGVAAGQTTPDARASLAVARCIGACGIAPAVVYDNKTVGHVSSDNLQTHLKEWLDGSR